MTGRTPRRFALRQPSNCVPAFWTAVAERERRHCFRAGGAHGNIPPGSPGRKRRGAAQVAVCKDPPQSMTRQVGQCFTNCVPSSGSAGGSKTKQGSAGISG